MILKYARGYDNRPNLEELPIKPSDARPPEFERNYSADGLQHNIGGAETIWEYDYLEYEELQTLLNFFGISDANPSRKGTFWIPDSYSIPRAWNGIITYSVPSRGDYWFSNVRFEITRMELL